MEQKNYKVVIAVVYHFPFESEEGEPPEPPTARVKTVRVQATSSKLAALEALYRKYSLPRLPVLKNLHAPEAIVRSCTRAALLEAMRPNGLGAWTFDVAFSHYYVEVHPAA